MTMPIGTRVRLLRSVAFGGRGDLGSVVEFPGSIGAHHVGDRIPVLLDGWKPPTVIYVFPGDIEPLPAPPTAAAATGDGDTGGGE